MWCQKSIKKSCDTYFHREQLFQSSNNGSIMQQAGQDKVNQTGRMNGDRLHIKIQKQPYRVGGFLTLVDLMRRFPLESVHLTRPKTGAGSLSTLNSANERLSSSKERLSSDFFKGSSLLRFSTKDGVPQLTKTFERSNRWTNGRVTNLSRLFLKSMVFVKRLCCCCCFVCRIWVEIVMLELGSPIRPFV